MQKEPNFILALDVSTSTIGIALFEDLGDSGELKLLHHVSPKVNQNQKTKWKSFLKKLKFFKLNF